MDHSQHHQDHSRHGQWTAAAHATLHCSIGCILGETAGLMLGTTLHFSQAESMIVSTVLAYCAGFSLAVVPLMRSTGLSVTSAFAAIWIGEAISIGVMELVMNAILNIRFWMALAVATAVAFLIAWPVNAWLIAKELRQHH
jgi:hypothetical protein